MKSCRFHAALVRSCSLRSAVQHLADLRLLPVLPAVQLRFRANQITKATAKPDPRSAGCRLGYNGWRRARRHDDDRRKRCGRDVRPLHVRRSRRKQESRRRIQRESGRKRRGLHDVEPGGLLVGYNGGLEDLRCRLFRGGGFLRHDRDPVATACACQFAPVGEHRLSTFQDDFLRGPEHVFPEPVG